MYYCLSSIHLLPHKLYQLPLFTSSTARVHSPPVQAGIQRRKTVSPPDLQQGQSDNNYAPVADNLSVQSPRFYRSNRPKAFRLRRRPRSAGIDTDCLRRRIIFLRPLLSGRRIRSPFLNFPYGAPIPLCISTCCCKVSN